MKADPDCKQIRIKFYIDLNLETQSWTYLCRDAAGPNCLMSTKLKFCGN